MVEEKISNAAQKVACDIVIDFYISMTNFVFDDIGIDRAMKWADSIFERYNLCEDPFTHLPCTSKEYAENSLKYEQLLMIEKYGHCDGLD